MGRRVPTRVAEVLLIAVMGVGSVFLWLGIPLGWLFIASRLSDKYPNVYLLALVFWGLDHSVRLGSPVHAVASHRLARPLVSVLLVAVAVVAVIEVVRIGDSGAQAVWHDGYRP